MSRLPEEMISTNSGWRVSQACDRCRMKKIKCDGGTPCKKCSSIGFECTTSDKLSRRAFPKGYTVNLEKRVKELEEEVMELRRRAENSTVNSAAESGGIYGGFGASGDNGASGASGSDNQQAGTGTGTTSSGSGGATFGSNIPINNPIDQIFNLDKKGIIIGNDNLNFESQFNHLLINLNLPFLKITNSHNFLISDPDSYLYHPTYTNYNEFHNKDLEVIYNPVAVNNHGNDSPDSSHLPHDVYDLFIKLINNFKKIFNSKKELDYQVLQFFLNYNTFIPIFDYKKFMESYDAFHTMYPFMFTYDDATINGFNLLTHDYHVVNEYMVIVMQIYAMISMTDPTLNMNLLLNHSHPNYSFQFRKGPGNSSILRSVYDFLPYMNMFYVSIDQLQTFLLFFYYSLLTNNKEKALLMSALINSYIGVLGINLNSRNLFFNDMSLTVNQRRDRVKIFWGFKVLLKCFNLKFGFKPSINTTVINPVTIERYFKLTPEKLSSLLDPDPNTERDPLFDTLLRPSMEFLNLMNIIIPSSFSPNYYQYLKHDKHVDAKRRSHPNNLDWILNDDDGDGNDGNLNYNYTQFLAIDKNLSNWRYALKEKTFDPAPLHTAMGLPVLASLSHESLYHRVNFDNGDSPPAHQGVSEEGTINFHNHGLPDVHTATRLIKMQLNFHYLLIRSSNYLNFVIDRELTQSYYVKIANLSREVLAYFVLIFDHVGSSRETSDGYDNGLFGGSSSTKNAPSSAALMASGMMGIDVDEDGFVINDFSVKRRKSSVTNSSLKQTKREVQPSPFNAMLNGLSLTIINFKKSIVLQMLYLLICTLKIAKKGGVMSHDTIRVLNRSISLFIKIFINYQPNANRVMKTKKVKEDDLFRRIIRDELKEEILKNKGNPDDTDDDDDDDPDSEIDWDDEEMDEDLKFLKILKYIKYKTNLLYERNLERRNQVKQEMDLRRFPNPLHPPTMDVSGVHSLGHPMGNPGAPAPIGNPLPGHIQNLDHVTVQLPPILPMNLNSVYTQGSPTHFAGPLSPSIYARQGGIPKMDNSEFFGDESKENDLINKRAANELVNLKHGRGYEQA